MMIKSFHDTFELYGICQDNCRWVKQWSYSLFRKCIPRIFEPTAGILVVCEGLIGFSIESRPSFSTSGIWKVVSPEIRVVTKLQLLSARFYAVYSVNWHFLFSVRDTRGFSSSKWWRNIGCMLPPASSTICEYDAEFGSVQYEMLMGMFYYHLNEIKTDSVNFFCRFLYKYLVHFWYNGWYFWAPGWRCKLSCSFSGGVLYVLLKPHHEVSARSMSKK